MKLSVRRRNLLRSSALAALLVAGLANRAIAADPTYQFNIPAESLSQALTDFSQTSSQQIIYTEDLVRGRKSAGLHGSYTAEHALEALLAGTGLKVQINAAGVMMVQSKNVQAASNEAAESTGAGSVETVVVTGSHLRDVESLTPVQTITSKDMENQGYPTLVEALQQLPANSKVGASTETSPTDVVGEASQLNYGYASGVNLRGLGPNDTLVLLNGRRLPPTAFGSTIDISGIPISAIDRVEILDDGASAIYGSDAIAGVVNIITKTNYSGVETGARMYDISNGKQPNYGGYFLGGYDWGSGDFTVDYDYEKQNILPNTARSYTAGAFSGVATSAIAPWDILPKQETSSYYASLDQTLAPDLQFTANAIYSDRSHFVVKPFDFGFGSWISQSSGSSRQLATTGELDYTAFSNWRFSLVGEYGSQSDTDNGLSTYSSGDTDVQTEPLDYRVESIEAQGDGSLFAISGGDVRLAVGGGLRHESYHQTGTDCYDGACSQLAVTDTHRGIYYAYAELYVPIVGPDNRIPFVQQLRLDVAGRYDHYSDFGSTTNPKVTLEWQPTDTVTLNGSYATSFKAPTLHDLAPSVFYDYIDPSNPADPSQGNALEITDGSNPNLRPETAVTYKAGATYKSDIVPGLELDTSFFDINYKSKIVNLSSTFSSTNVLNGQLGSFVNTNPTPAQIAAAEAAATASGGQVFCFSASCSPITAIADLGLNNAAVVHVQGLDFQGSYSADVDLGHISISADASYYLDYTQRASPVATPQPDAGIVYKPTRFRGKINFGWSNGPWVANARLNYVGSEKNLGYTDPTCPAPISACHISSWTTVDLSVSYAFDDIPTAHFLDGTRLSLSVANVFDRNPPFVTNQGTGINYDPVNANPLGRAISIAISKRW